MSHYSILAWEISWTEEPGRLQPTGHKRIGHDLATNQQQLLLRLLLLLSHFSCV